MEQSALWGNTVDQEGGSELVSKISLLLIKDLTEEQAFMALLAHSGRRAG
jgi:hypothetical protein